MAERVINSRCTSSSAKPYKIRDARREVRDQTQACLLAGGTGTFVVNRRDVEGAQSGSPAQARTA